MQCPICCVTYAVSHMPCHTHTYRATHMYGVKHTNTGTQIPGHMTRDTYAGRHAHGCLETARRSSLRFLSFFFFTAALQQRRASLAPCLCLSPSLFVSPFPSPSLLCLSLPALSLPPSLRLPLPLTPSASFPPPLLSRCPVLNRWDAPCPDVDLNPKP